VPWAVEPVFEIDAFDVISRVVSTTVNTSERMRAVKAGTGSLGRRVRLGVCFATHGKGSVIFGAVSAEALCASLTETEESAFVSRMAPSPAAAALGEARMHNGLADGSVPPTDLDTVINEPYGVCTLLRVPDIEPHGRGIGTSGVAADAWCTRELKELSQLVTFHGVNDVDGKDGPRSVHIRDPDDFQSRLGLREDGINLVAPRAQRFSGPLLESGEIFISGNIITEGENASVTRLVDDGLHA